MDFANVKTDVELAEQFLLRNRAQGDRTDFWKLWMQYRDNLYQRCLLWMKGNATEAQEALSRSSIKAWEKWQNHAIEITNPRAWVTRLTYNLCMDMHRERNRGARSVESLEKIAVAELECLASSVPSPESEVLSSEMELYINRAIDTLPVQLRIPFLLRYDQEMSYHDIAKQLALSNENARKRIQQAKAILRKRLNKYFSGMDNSSASATCLNFSLNRGVRNHRGLSPYIGTEVVATYGNRVLRELEDTNFPIQERQFCHEAMKSAWEKPECEHTTTSECQMPITAGCTPKFIDYKVTATCLEVLPHTWYNSLSSLGWR